MYTFVEPDSKINGHPRPRSVACTPSYCCRYINAWCSSYLPCWLAIVNFFSVSVLISAELSLRQSLAFCFFFRVVRAVNDGQS